MLKLTLILGTLIGSWSAVAADETPDPPDRGTCTCTDNRRTECDAGGFLHEIKDCHWSSDGSYCGYHDEVIGRCPV